MLFAFSPVALLGHDIIFSVEKPVATIQKVSSWGSCLALQLNFIEQLCELYGSVVNYISV